MAEKKEAEPVLVGSNASTGKAPHLSLVQPAVFSSEHALAEEIVLKVYELSGELAEIAPDIALTSVDLRLFADRTQRQAAIIMGELGQR